MFSNWCFSSPSCESLRQIRAKPRFVLLGFLVSVMAKYCMRSPKDPLSRKKTHTQADTKGGRVAMKNNYYVNRVPSPAFARGDGSDVHLCGLEFDIVYGREERGTWESGSRTSMNHTVL